MGDGQSPGNPLAWGEMLRTALGQQAGQGGVDGELVVQREDAARGGWSPGDLGFFCFSPTPLPSECVQLLSRVGVKWKLHSSETQI